MIIALGFVLLALTSYISTLAYALRDHSRSRLGEMFSNGERDRKLDWLDKHEWELQALGGMLRFALSVSLLIVVWRSYAVDPRHAADLGVLGAAAGITIALLVVFAVALPHALAVHGGEGVLARSFGVLAAMRLLMWPLGRFYGVVEFIVRRLLGKSAVSEEQESERVEQDILEAVSEGEAHGAVDGNQKEMIESVLELDETTVSAIMTPRTDVNAVSEDVTFDDVRSLILEKGHSRIPVYHGTIDHVVGVVYAKDLLRLDHSAPFDASRTMRAVRYVPETKTLADLLREFQASKVQIAIVLDEYGGTAGLVTIEDILEELVGEIDDEYDEEPPPPMNRIDSKTLEVDGRVHIDEINSELDIELPEEEDYETIAGFVFATLGKIPAVGEELTHKNIHIKIVDAEARKINRLRLHVLRQAESA